MKAAVILSCLLSTASIFAQAQPVNQGKEEAASKQIKQWQKQYNNYIDSSLKKGTGRCTSKNVRKRQEWGSMSKKQRSDYIDAVKCLRSKPPRSSKSEVPGARSRFDDFGALHIMKTPEVHFSGLFLHFHRYLIWTYETILRDECGYKGAQPYWDWTQSWQDPRKSPVFDGGPYSMGGNGRAIPHGPVNISAFGIDLTIQPATGGGCIESGPFKDMQITLGPVAFEPKGPMGGLGSNPRCLRRDISPVWSGNLRPTNTTKLIGGCEDIECFDAVIEDLSGLHAGAHFTIGAQNIDAYAASTDPAFFLLHANVDRTWTIWQNLKPEQRTRQIWGTQTAFNNPPSANVTQDTLIDLGILAEKKSIRDLSSSIGGPLCYEYV